MRSKGLALCLVSAALAAAALPASALSVTSVTVSVSPTHSEGPCPAVFKFTGKVALNGKGRFTYKWERSDGAVDTLAHPAVEYDGVNAALVTETWTLGAAMPAFHPFHGWVKLHVLTPTDRLSGPAESLMLPPSSVEPPPLEAMMAAAATYGLEILGPPGIPS